MLQVVILSSLGSIGRKGILYKLAYVALRTYYSMGSGDKAAEF
jgi:hypothetical protein